ADRLRSVGIPGAKAKGGVVCRVAFADALVQRNAAVTTNKAVITVTVSWRTVFIQISVKHAPRSFVRPISSWSPLNLFKYGRLHVRDSDNLRQRPGFQIRDGTNPSN